MTTPFDPPLKWIPISHWIHQNRSEYVYKKADLVVYDEDNSMAEIYGTDELRPIGLAIICNGKYSYYEEACFDKESEAHSL